MDFAEFEKGLLAAAHTALGEAVAAATRDARPSLLGAALAARLLRLLQGSDPILLRAEAYRRLAARFPRDVLQQLTAADFMPAEQEMLLLGRTELE